MKVLFVTSFLGTYSVHKAQIELVLSLNKKVDELLLIGEFSKENLVIFQKEKIQITHKKLSSKIDNEFVGMLKEISVTFNPDIVHVINNRLLRQVNIAFKNHKAKIVGYFGSTSLYWHDISSYFTFLSPRVDKIICNSSYVYNHVCKQLLWRKHKAVKIYKGYDVTWFKDVVPFNYSKLGIKKYAIIVVLAATHTNNKRIKDFINSSNFLKTNRNVHYVVLGHKTDSDDLQVFKNQSVIKDKIHLLGLRKDAVELIKGADIYVQTSLKEGFGRAVSEAMCVAKPIVMTNCGGGTELIDENTGFIVPVKSPKAIASALSKLINNDDLRVKMGVNSQKRISNKYNINNTITDTLRLYKRLLES